LIAPVDVGAHARRSAHKCVNLRICAYNALAWAGLKKTMKGAKVRVFVLVTVLCVRACLQERACVCMCMCVCTCRHRGQSVCVSVCVCKCVSVRVCVPVDKGGIQALPHTTAVGQAASRKHRKKKQNAQIRLACNRQISHIANCPQTPHYVVGVRLWNACQAKAQLCF